MRLGDMRIGKMRLGEMLPTAPLIPLWSSQHSPDPLPIFFGVLLKLWEERR